ncbi:MAG: response regulator [Desulfobacter sp.]|nr:MAG: response regulator [Desulfobacter sp.]
MDQINPLEQYTHKVLTVGNIQEQSRDVGPVLQGLGIESVHVDTADQAVSTIEKAPRPFSIVICDQRLEGMTGSELLAHVKKNTPETIRFLITRYSDMETIISAVNTGAVHRYISMPWNETQMEDAVSWGTRSYEHHLESKKLFTMAKAQNGKLYELNCELVEAAKRNDTESKTLEREIAGLKAALSEKSASRPMSQKKIITLILHAIQNTDKDPGEMLNALYTQSIMDLYSAFTDLALRNGIEMPEQARGGADD